LEAQDVSHALATSATYTDPIHLLLTDVIMPSMNGPDLAQRLVARRPDIKVLYMSGFSNALLSEKDQRHRRIWFLAKPFTPQVLAAKVRHCLDEAE
jgi:DNA-binding NtrC family response regulator